MIFLKEKVVAPVGTVVFFGWGRDFVKSLDAGGGIVQIGEEGEVAGIGGGKKLLKVWGEGVDRFF